MKKSDSQMAPVASEPEASGPMQRLRSVATVVELGTAKTGRENCGLIASKVTMGKNGKRGR